MADGRVLVPDIVPSSDGSGGLTSSVELYDSTTGSFTQAGPMDRYRFGMSMTLLADGRVLVAGNQGVVLVMGAKLTPEQSAQNDADRASAELYLP